MIMHADIAPSPQATARRAAEWISKRIEATPDVFRIALSGGETPRLLYSTLASAPYRDRIDWRRVDLFWGDERFVPHSDERSNYRMAREELLARVPVLIDHVHPVITEGDPETAARRYEGLLRAAYGSECLAPSLPLFHLVLLGLGTDGHTASLLPGSEALDERQRWVMGVQGHDVPRITLTYPAIACSSAVMFLVTGREKAEPVARVHAGDPDLPATHIHSEGEIVWFLDEAAASKLPASVRR
ncbi:MAG: 6-phosphogluconolactonase [Alphaproteobacteria bacterium]|nr:6-phosphogluconolactonase [Alphaproteobacteria bacterium]